MRLLQNIRATKQRISIHPLIESLNESVVFFMTRNVTHGHDQIIINNLLKMNIRYVFKRHFKWFRNSPHF
jgi:hypothetical protein